tara:strand:- start:912 stop:1541 length:630 start_codon:yes stop_codon:yes gene_type:complete
MRLFIITLIISISDAWDSSFLLPNIPIDRWTHVRNNVLKEQGKNKSFLDIGCGLGFSTSKTTGSLGIDSSRENIEKAKVLFPEKDFQLGVVSSWKDKKTYDISTCMFYLHEIPSYKRKNVIETAIYNAKERVIIVDVCPDFVPEREIAIKKPYLNDYLLNCRNELRYFKESVLVENHIHKWVLELNSEDEQKKIYEENMKQILRFYRPI